MEGPQKVEGHNQICILESPWVGGLCGEWLGRDKNRGRKLEKTSRGEIRKAQVRAAAGAMEKRAWNFLKTHQKNRGKSLDPGVQGPVFYTLSNLLSAAY